MRRSALAPSRSATREHVAGEFSADPRRTGQAVRIVAARVVQWRSSPDRSPAIRGPTTRRPRMGPHVSASSVVASQPCGASASLLLRARPSPSSAGTCSALHHRQRRCGRSHQRQAPQCDAARFESHRAAGAGRRHWLPRSAAFSWLLSRRPKTTDGNMASAARGTAWSPELRHASFRQA